MHNGAYKKIIFEYLNAAEKGEKPSISKIAKTLKVSEEKVRRTLITEEMWTSKTAKQVTDLYHQGMTVSEIACKLVMSEKNVQSYIPYSRGMYGGDASLIHSEWEPYGGNMPVKTDEIKTKGLELIGDLPRFSGMIVTLK